MAIHETTASYTDVIDGNNSNNVASEAPYVYQRSDGTVEKANSIEDAIARCPVLGRIAIEAPEQASIMLELAAVGNAKLEAAATASQKPEADSLTGPRQKREAQTTQNGPTEKITASDAAKIENLHTQQREHPELLTESPRAAVLPAQARVEHVAPIAPAKVSRATVHRQINESTHVEAASVPKVESLPSHAKPMPNSQRREVPTETPKINKPIKEQTYAAQSERVDRSTKASTKISEDRGLVERAEGPVSPLASYEKDAEIQELALHPDTAEADFSTEQPLESESPEPSAIQSVSLIAHESLTVNESEEVETFIDEEATEAYQQLMDLITATTVERSRALASSESVEVVRSDNEAKIFVRETDEMNVNEFEDFLMTQPVSEPMIMENRLERAGEPPLEQTLVNLVEVLKKPDKESETTELHKALEEIESTLIDCYEVILGGEIQIRITPELTEKIIKLLYVLDYENPAQVLVDFVERRGIVFMLHAFAYMCQLNHEDNQQEFVLPARASAITGKVSNQLRLSKIITSLIINKEFQLEP